MQTIFKGDIQNKHALLVCAKISQTANSSPVNLMQVHYVSTKYINRYFIHFLSIQSLNKTN